MNENPEKNVSDAPEHSLLRDAKILKDRFRGEYGGKFPAPPPRFSIRTALLLYWGYVLLMTALFLFAGPLFERGFSAPAALYAGLTVLVSGSGVIFCAFYCKKKYGALVEMLLSSALRTGIPLLVALVFYFTMDKMILRSAILTLAAFYVLTLPFVVWVTLPRRPSAGGAEARLKQDESIKNER